MTSLQMPKVQQSILSSKDKIIADLVKLLIVTTFFLMKMKSDHTKQML